MKVLVFGPSASGKTYIAKALRRQGINAYDDTDISGLSNWYNRNGEKVAEPATSEEAFEKGYSFLWSRKFLAGFFGPTHRYLLVWWVGQYWQCIPTV